MDARRMASTQRRSSTNIVSIKPRAIALYTEKAHTHSSAEICYNPIAAHDWQKCDRSLN